MSDPPEDRLRWERRYTENARERKPPHEWLLRHIDRLPQQGKALDVACGLGRNAFPLVRHGLEVTGVDLSPTAIEQLRGWCDEDGVSMDLRAGDLKEWGWPMEEFAVAIQFYFLDRMLLPQLKNSIKPGGWILFETATVHNIALGGLGPKRPEWCLEEGELARIFSDYAILENRETILGGPMSVASIIAQKPDNFK